MIPRVLGAYRRNHRIVDTIAVSLASIALIVAWELELIGGTRASRSVTLFATIAGLAGTLLGFAITSLAILIGLFQSREFGPLRKNKQYGAIFTDYKFAIVLLALTTLVALGATVAASSRVYSPIILGSVVGLVGWSSVTMAHAVEILWLAIKTHARAEQEF